MEGLIVLSRKLLCKAEVLGCTFPAKIAGINVTINFPLWSPSKSNPSPHLPQNLLPPLSCHEVDRDKSQIIWGNLANLKVFDSRVMHLGISFFGEKENNNDLAKISFNIKNWDKAFFDYCMACNGHGSDRDLNLTYSNSRLLLLDNGKCVNAGTYYVSLQYENKSHFLNKEQIMSAIKFASTGKELLPEYQMLVAAYNAKRGCYNRQAVIDASSALELCFIRYIESYCQSKGLNSETILGKNHTLGNKLSYMMKIDDMLGVCYYNCVYTGIAI